MAPEALQEPGAVGPDIESVLTLPRALSAHGYATFQGGKYWEGTYEMGGFTHGMTRTAGGDRLGDYAGGAGLRLGRETMQPVVDFIDDFIGASAEHPFFIWFAPALPHGPFDAPSKYRVQYQAERGFAKGYYANVTRLDDVIGELLAHLDSRGLTSSTLVVFVADNGWDRARAAGPRRRRLKGGPRGKESLYELGVRTPVVFRCPGRIPAATVTDALVSTVDLVPTLLDYAGVPAPSTLPGRSLRPVLEGRSPGVRQTIVGRMSRIRDDLPNGTSLSAPQPASFVRTHRWHYVWYETDDRHELYDMTADPGQTRDAAAAHPDVVEELQRLVGRWRTDPTSVP
jgi:uncharacterized sulfatase